MRTRPETLYVFVCRPMAGDQFHDGCGELRRLGGVHLAGRDCWLVPSDDPEIRGLAFEVRGRAGGPLPTTLKEAYALVDQAQEAPDVG